MTISFFVPGHPKTAGSKRAFIPKGWNRAIITDDAGKAGKDWRHDVQKWAKAEYKGAPLTGALEVAMRFCLARPKAHYRTGKHSDLLKMGVEHWHTKKPDVLKMARAVEDALTGIIWKDDAQICCERLLKSYGTEVGCHIQIETLYDHTQP